MVNGNEGGLLRLTFATFVALAERVLYMPFGIAIGLKIWKARNSFIFEGVSTGPEAIVVQGQRWAKQVKYSSMKPRRRAVAFPKQVCWQPPAPGWTKMNVDGAVDPLVGAAAAGGVLRSTNGSWLAGFAHNLGICSVTNAELWGLLDGLQIAWSLGTNKVEVESDNMSVIQWLNNHNQESMDNALICSIRELMSRSWHVKLHHVFREGNAIADAMARIRPEVSLGMMVFQQPSEVIVPTLNDDRMGVSRTRHINPVISSS
ncbi:hypothetical protein K2173_013802 [Erythroxylum novogranatense]|uniref:RNase H type-1 domain-containing protein n=1 Tax=Erythroxylum novogranatense TaxID=1862640 RepID=A0AAV8SCD3_9ROSI|nr:hypothetical protein K2173_013802 [Erythroxylum novogranatense]